MKKLFLLAALVVAAPALGATRARHVMVKDAPFYVTDYGATPDDGTDDTAAIQAALSAARAAGGGEVVVGKGTFIIAPPAQFSCIGIGSSTWFHGQGPSTVLKVKDGAGSYRTVFCPDDGSGSPDPSDDTSRVTVSDMRIDQNCATSGGDVRNSTDGKNFMVFLWWKGAALTVERVTFDPICGVNTVVMNNVAVKDAVVRDCRFQFVKGPTTDPTGFYDNTAVYLHGYGLAATGNWFETTAADGARGAIELHGRSGLATHNRTNWYRSCVRFTAGSTTAELGLYPNNPMVANDNVCENSYDAINSWAESGQPFRGGVITGNTITLANAAHEAADPTNLGTFQGISLHWATAVGNHGDHENYTITGNTIIAEKTEGLYDDGAKSRASAALISLQATGNIKDVIVSGNVLKNSPVKGIALQAQLPSAWSGATTYKVGDRVVDGGTVYTSLQASNLNHATSDGAWWVADSIKASRVRIENNVIVDAGNDSLAGFKRGAIIVAGVLEDVIIAQNSIVSSTAPTVDGLYSLNVSASSGSARVAIYDNTVVGDYTVSTSGLTGVADGGWTSRAKSTSVSPGAGSTIAGVDVSQYGVWDLTITGGNNFTVGTPFYAVPGQRLLIRLRNGRGGGGVLGTITWPANFKMSAWTNPADANHRALWVEWNGTNWVQIAQSVSDIPN